MFLTNPTSIPVMDLRKRRPRTEIDLKEEVVRQLMALGVCREAAELAVIDLKDYVIRGHQEKRSAVEIAHTMMPEVSRIYKARMERS